MSHQYGGHGTGRLVVDAKVSWMALHLQLFGRPRLAIDGYPVAVRWGRNVYDLPAGQHGVHAGTTYLGWDGGVAQAVAAVAAGRETVLYYKAPVALLGRGALDGKSGGFPGTGLMVGCCLGGLALVAGLAVLIAFVG